MNILETIIACKRKEVEERKLQVPVAVLEQESCFTRPTLSLASFLLDETKTGIIAEFKRRSPSKGVINDQVSVASVTRAYAEHGASGLSVLTDEQFFGGSLEDLLEARASQVPILRKDFIVDEYQLVEAKAYGADVILLIAACLSPTRVKQLAGTAQGLGLEVLLELHDDSELGHICPGTDMIGVNNRNLKNFEVDLQHSVRLAEQIGEGQLKIAESGINKIENIQYLKQHGFRGFLVGEYFMKQEDPGRAFREFSDALNKQVE